MKFTRHILRYLTDEEYRLKIVLKAFNKKFNKNKTKQNKI